MKSIPSRYGYFAANRDTGEAEPNNVHYLVNGE
jgi:hypothetical protein